MDPEINVAGKETAWPSAGHAKPSARAPIPAAVSATTNTAVRAVAIIDTEDT
jgi:hypothetical protein